MYVPTTGLNLGQRIAQYFVRQQYYIYWPACVSTPRRNGGRGKGRGEGGEGGRGEGGGGERREE